ncbi:MAG: FAD-dependent oxidoreductase [Oscillospiraceae bacterium]|jgi:hypothetical protein|nr:FAD-dependent oxidoreductase [Oscillospiraceae bacterium]
MEFIVRPEQKVTARHYDVVVAGGGTGGVFAAIAAARRGAKVALIEQKGYVGGIAAEGGCGLHSFYNLGRAFGVEKRKVVRGIPEEFIDRLFAMGGCSGHNATILNYEYDDDSLCVDVEVYKLAALEMLREAGVHVMLNTFVADVLGSGDIVTGVITESHEGCEAVMGKLFIDSTGYGDLCARAGAKYSEPNDYAVANSMGVGGIDIDRYYEAMKENGSLREYARGPRSGKENQIIRVSGNFLEKNADINVLRDIGMAPVTTTIHDNYFMFIKLNYIMPVSPTNRDALADAEYELRRRQRAAVELLRKNVPGAENAFIARTAPAVTIRRARCIECDYDITNEEIMNGTHYPDEVFSYGFHDLAPQVHIRDGGTYGLPYRSMIVKNKANVFAIGMMVTSDFTAHMSTRNTVSCMAMGQAAGTAAALLATSGLNGVRDLPYEELYKALKADGVWFDAEAPYMKM